MHDRIINDFQVFKYLLLLAAMSRPRSLYICLCVSLCKVILFRAFKSFEAICFMSVFRISQGFLMGVSRVSHVCLNGVPRAL